VLRMHDWLDGWDYWKWRLNEALALNQITPNSIRISNQAEFDPGGGLVKVLLVRPALAMPYLSLENEKGGRAEKSTYLGEISDLGSE